MRVIGKPTKADFFAARLATARSSLVSPSKVSPHLLSSTSSNGNITSCPNVAIKFAGIGTNNDISTKKNLFPILLLRHSSSIEILIMVTTKGLLEQQCQRYLIQTLMELLYGDTLGY
ncbi:BBT_HP_G0132240.mRNA.1.CDS.1 [Saccharomyces cerevisiae]|nr:BBT_HP_G0132240.mRNA.1.CDS.1 [Saccharomyces cerevisiae]CAI6975907.1 BBT_HP_G0132240.mRNA.1.CDS.1 [Saccharomyces cerevisiae]